MNYRLIHSQQPAWSEEVWDDFVAAHAHAHPLQMRAWGQLKREYGWRDIRLGFEMGGELVCGAQVLFRKPPRLDFSPLSIAYAPKGPLLTWDDPAQVQAFLPTLYRFCLRRGAVLLKIEPELSAQEAPESVLRACGFRPSPRPVQPRTTLWLDLRPDEDAILAQMKQKWRYNIRLARRKGVTVREGGHADLAMFAHLMAITGERNRFGVHAPDYYQRFWELFAPSGQATLLIAEHAEEPLAAIMVVKLADKAYYFYGGSANTGRNLMPNHLLQWEAIRWARAQGCAWYDFWGVPDEVGLDPTAPAPDPPTGLWGVWRFKRGFGGQVVRYTGAWDRTFMPWLPAI